MSPFLTHKMNPLMVLTIISGTVNGAVSYKVNMDYCFTPVYKAGWVTLVKSLGAVRSCFEFVTSIFGGTKTRLRWL